MKKRTNFLMLGLFALLFSQCIQMSESVTDQTTGANGGFEILKDKLPVNWLFYTQKTTGTGDFQIISDSIEVKEGKRSLKFEVKSCSDKGGRFSPGMTQEFEATAGENYRVSFWIKNKGTKFAVKLSAVNATEGVPGPSLETDEDISEWRLYEYHFTIPADMKRLRLELTILSPGTFWIDDVRIEKEN